MQPLLDHVQITVRDMRTALPFYDRLMPLLGFDPARRSEAYVDAHDLHVVEYAHPNLCFGISSPRASEANATVHRRRPGSLHHLAFRAESRAEVDRFAAELEGLTALGATIVDGPRVFPEHVPAGYYAVFFKDPDGIKYEVVHC